jgi:hypothetical protein
MVLFWQFSVMTSLLIERPAVLGAPMKGFYSSSTLVKSVDPDPSV